MNMEQEKKEPQTISPKENSQILPAGFKFEELELSVEQMLKSGVHFGHKKSRWNPKMKPYIFSVRGNINIIDLEKTYSLLEKALEFVRTLVTNGGKILFVGTKPQARELVMELAQAVEMPYVVNRWLGGTFTNYSEIKKRIKYLNEQEEKMARNEFEKYTKYEQMQFKKEIERMNEKMGGIKKMESLPQAILVTDVNENKLVIREAKEIKVPVIAIVDTNVDPDLVDYPIPGNDDALSSLRYILGMISKTVKESKARPKNEKSEKGNKIKKIST
jgi:small subunit ribosomal protein S2